MTPPRQCELSGFLKSLNGFLMCHRITHKKLSTGGVCFKSIIFKIFYICLLGICKICYSIF